MNSSTLTIGTKEFDPYVTACGVKTLRTTTACSHPGLDNEILDHLLTYLQIPYTVVPLNDSVEWGDFPNNGSALSGTLGMVDRGEVDLTSATWSYTSQRMEFFDTTYPMIGKEITFVSRSRLCF